MKRYRNWIIALVLSATAGAVAIQNGLAPSLSESTESPLPITSTDAPTTTPTYEPCGYMWAYKDVPELLVKSTPRPVDRITPLSVGDIPGIVVCAPE